MAAMPHRAGMGSKPAREQQHDENDHDDTEDANSPMAKAIAVAAEATAEAADQEDDQDDDQYESKRRGLSPIAGARAVVLRRFGMCVSRT
jgi:hypothetical protein